MVQPTRNDSCPLRGKIALVTGASRGIGRATALALAKDGADIAAIARTEAALTSLASELRDYDVRYESYICDVSLPEALEQTLATIGQQLGVVQILVNCAGVYETASVRGHSLNLWNKIVETNLTSVLRTCKSLIEGMITTNWGRIVNVSSISGKSGEPYGAAYSASKFGLIGLTQSLALEVAKFGITVNAVCPGWVRTEMAISQLTDARWCELNGIPGNDSIEIARLSVPQLRFIEPEEVADLISFLCGTKAQAITGQAINICGGLSIH